LKQIPTYYVAAAQALEQAQRAFSAALATPEPPIIPVAEVEALRAEITALREAADRDRATIDNLWKDAEESCRSLNALRAQKDAALELERTALAKENELLATQRTAFEAEKKAMVEERKSIAQGLHRMIQIIQPNPFPTPAQLATVVPANGTVLTSAWTDDRAGGES
jgi:hypothetical protein